MEKLIIVERFQQEWTTKLMNDDSFTDPIPSNQEDFVALVTAREDYKIVNKEMMRVINNAFTKLLPTSIDLTSALPLVL